MIFQINSSLAPGFVSSGASNVFLKSEVDFIVSRGSAKVGIEVKFSNTWDSDFNKGLNVLLESGKIKEAFGVYNGKEILKKGHVKIYPVNTFVNLLFQGKVF